ncbi:arginine biosynthesis bifunctional protein ARG7, mitochondrial precursor [Histoplasma mississippiense (nom. inval.)]|uniref:Arginine biosynthesis bifunctional protein ArgJ, mitochondrial n=1 Tax=Ajellomyces capsulatus (strain NAm1 / WU24) TaxID=2059318 RepID=ARGJ_AJECN|nr:arginine biosynthesis bifunctional protein ARG7, mitochondrial precursor [Histoplasma mississippiense (nom. inval.)]A6R040.1 RecName: Full=Arginine biosynthesis bifunctional protein ArgJ, mitochondrial; Includes: RecName: Full=Glutamate N-acetyltransferase; Short=GAT; AltName: Full=Ornithine acetyltransferase; Short=OATase; AltName: Full=Ornithine transacetylase; Includes: RecName: Full=Amino-acid acetyltransferase; AltName: Full=N-acetylglutamate synthase; Short=AGS; Contains: RecName: Full=Ar
MKNPKPFGVVAGFVRLHKSSLGQARYYSIPNDVSIPASKRKFIPSSGTYPKGFLVACAHAGVKESNTQFPDVALICSETPCSAAAVFTTNKFQAAPVQVSKQVLEKRQGAGIRGVVINSGCANAVTGKGGLEHAKMMSAKVDECNGTPSTGPQDTSTLVMSTGVIGQRLPIKKILDAIPTAHSNLASTHSTWLATARAICTTDTFPKLLSRPFTLPSSPNRQYCLAGMTKGAGMIHPNMATLLGILCTDVPISPSALKALLTHAVSRSFNAISIDGDTSTNDTIALLANGAAGGEAITTTSSPDYAAMQTILTSFAQSLAQLVVRDGEGATKFIMVRVCNSPSHADAKVIASTIARSPLVKTALYGKDANWGRILCAIGYAQGIAEGTVVPERTSVSFRPVDGSAELKLLVNGERKAWNESRREDLADEDLEIVLIWCRQKGEKGLGGGGGVVLVCDFSHEYVTINGDYRT